MNQSGPTVTIFDGLFIENYKKNRNKLKFIFMTIVGLAESFKTITDPAQSDPTVTLFDGLLLRNYNRSSFKSSIFTIKI